MLLRRLGVWTDGSARLRTVVLTANGVSWPAAVAQVKAVGEKVVTKTVFVAVDVGCVLIA